MNSYTVISYNGVTITNCHTTSFDQEPVYDQSGTDLMFFRFRIRVSGLVHGHNYSAPAPNMQAGSTGGTAANNMISIRHRLGTPRAQFRMSVGVGSSETVLLECTAFENESQANSSVSRKDLDNGPRCNLVSIGKITGNEIFNVTCEFQIAMLQCDPSGDASSCIRGVLSNRWTQTDEIDRDFNTTRTFAGRLRVASARLNPHAFRDYVVPPLASGMQRQSMNFTATADGLHLDYQIVDRETHFAAPAPATYWQINHTETTGTGIKWYSEVTVRMAGDRDVDKKRLIGIGVQIVFSLVGSANLDPVQNRGGIVESLVITDNIGNEDNSIVVMARVTRVTEAIIKAQVKGESLGKPIDAQAFAATVANYDRNLNRGNRPGEVLETNGAIDIAGAFAAHLQTACQCSAGHNIAEGTPVGSVGTPESRVTPTLSVVPTSDSLPEETVPYLSQSHLTNMYTFWQMESTYDVRSNKIQLPIAAGSGSSSSQNADSCVFVEMARATAKRIAKFKGERVDAPPEIPVAADFTDSQTGIRFVFLTARGWQIVPTRTPDGKQLYTIQGEYVYGLSRAPRAGEAVPIGFNPWDNLGVRSLSPPVDGLTA